MYESLIISDNVTKGTYICSHNCPSISWTQSLAHLKHCYQSKHFYMI